MNKNYGTEFSGPGDDYVYNDADDIYTKSQEEADKIEKARADASGFVNSQSFRAGMKKVTEYNKNYALYWKINEEEDMFTETIKKA